MFTLLLAVVTLATQASSSEPRVVCYYTNWSVYRPGTARFNPQNINPYLCTHLVYAFGGFTKENSLKPFDKYQDIEKGGYAKFTGLKTYNKNLKTLLAIGGWNEGSARFSPMVASRERRRELVRNAIKFLRQNRFDGLDLDWEYPAFRDGGKPKDRENYAKLVKELREEFEKEAEKTKKPRLLLTMAVPAGIEYIQKGFDVKTLNQYLDWMNLLTYDYHSAFEPAVNHHAPLFPLEEPNEYSVDNELNIDYTIKFYLENGADPDKLVLGIPTYGRSYTLFNPDATEIGAPADGPGDQGEATREKGYLAYYEICESLKPKTKKPRSPDDDDDDEDSEEDVEDLPWTVVHPNPSAMGPVAYRGNQWVGYDDIDIVKKKAEYVAENRLGGIMFWSIDNDDFRGNCHGKPYPLIEAAKEAYVNKLGSTDNVVVSERPTSGSARRRARPRSSTTSRPSTAARIQSTSRPSVSSTTPSWNIVTPEPPTTPDPGADFKCTDEGFFQHPRDCKKYFWCLDSGPSNLGIVAHQFTCPSGLFFNKAADSCDFARNVLCKKPSSTTKAPAPTTSTTTASTTTTRKPIKLVTKNSLLFRTTTTTTTPEPEEEEEYEDDIESGDIEAEDPRVIKELIDLIKKVGGVEQLEKHLHLSEGSSDNGASTTTPSSFNKKLYQKVLERTRGSTRLSGNTIGEIAFNSRRGPQNAGLETSDSDQRLLRKDRPQYTTINRSRSSTAAPDTSEIEDIEVPIVSNRARAAEPDIRVSSGTKPLQYVNIRRARPAGTSDTADDTATRNALFERSEPYVSVAESPNSLDILAARRENLPEYVTIRRQRPTTEETTTQQYESLETEDSSLEITEKEISSPPSHPTYTSIVRSRPTTLPTEEPSSPQPTTVLAVKITSLLNNPTEEATTNFEVTEEETVPTTKATTATTAAPTTRRNILRRRGTTTTTLAPPSSTSASQVSSRNYTFVRRRRPLARPNEIGSESEDTNSRTIRSTTPDSREGFRASPRRFRQRIQTNANIAGQVEDSVPEAASQVPRGNFRPNLNPDELLSLTPIDVFDEPRFIQRENYNAARNDRRFRSRISVVTEKLLDSDVSAATIEVNRENARENVVGSRQNVPRYRGRGRFQSISTTETLVETPKIDSAPVQRRPYTRFTPRPFSRTITEETNIDTGIEEDLSFTTPRVPARIPFGRVRPSSSTRQLPSFRRSPLLNRQTTTQTPIVRETEDEINQEKNDDIDLSETAIEEQEHEDSALDGTEDIPKRRIVIKKIIPTTPTDDTTPFITSSESSVSTDDTGKRRFKIIRRRPATSTTIATEFENTVSKETPTVPRIRKVIRKKIKPIDNEPEIIAKSIGSLNAERETTQLVVNYGEKTRPTVSISSATDISTEKMISETSSEGNKDSEINIEEESEDHQQDFQNTNEAGETQNKIMTSDEKESSSKSEAAVLTETQTKYSSSVKEIIEDDHEKHNKDEEVDEIQQQSDEDINQQSTTKATTQETSPTTKSRLPYRPPKRIFTTSTESPSPSSGRTYSRKYNGAAYTTPTNVGANSQPDRPITRRPLFSARPFTRRPYTTARTTKKEDEDEYYDDDINDEEPENKIVLVPSGQLFTRKPSKENNEYEPTEEYSDEEDEEVEFKVTSKRPSKPRVINSNTFRTTSTTTELPKIASVLLNRTSIYSRFGNRPGSNDTRKRTQNIPIGYPVQKLNVKETENIVNDFSTTENADFTTATEDDDYLTMTESTETQKPGSDYTEINYTNTVDITSSTDEMEISDSTDDYLEYTEDTTSYPIYDATTQNDEKTIQTNDKKTTYEATQTESVTTTDINTTLKPTSAPVYKTQFDKLFAVSRIVEVSSKLNKHRLTKDNKTRLIEEGQVMQEKKPTVDKIGEVSRFSLIRIIEDDIPIYLTKLGHVYPVDNPPDNPIRIDEARNARALVNFSDAPKENLVASESINEQYRHVNAVPAKSNENTKPETVEKLPNDDFLSFINEEMKIEEHTVPYYEPDPPKWQFVPAAYENEKNLQNKRIKSLESITPRSEVDPLTLPLEGLFKTENPITARKINNENINKEPFLVYSAPASNYQDTSNIMRLRVTKPSVGQAVLTYVKGQELLGASVTEQATTKYSTKPFDYQSTTEIEQSTNTEKEPVTLTTHLVEMSTTQTTTTEYTTTEPTTTETIPEETTTQKLSPLDARKTKFPFPRRALPKLNVTRPNPIPSNTSKIRKTNATTTQGQKDSKKSGFNPNKSRFSAVRTQNVPIDVRKNSTAKPAPRNTNDSQRSSGDRKLYFKPIRPIQRPGFTRRNSTKTVKDRRNNFLRRTKAPTTPRSTTAESETTTDHPETTTKSTKSTRRGISKFKTPGRKQTNKKITEAAEEKVSSSDSENRGKSDGRPSLSGSGSGPKRNDRRPYVRRRLGGANATTSAPTTSTSAASSTSTSASTASLSSTRRPFRVASRRRPVGSTTAATTVVEDEVDDAESIEESELKPRTTKKTVKIQKRPLLALKNLSPEDIDNHPSATNEEIKGQRESKKYSSSFKQNQLDEVLKKNAEDVVTSTERRATSMDLDAETAVAIATHQLLSAPLPILNNFDVKTTKKPTYDTSHHIQTIQTTRAPTTTANSIPTGISIQSYSTNLPSTAFYSSPKSPFSTSNDGYSTLRTPGFSSPRTLFSQPAGFTSSVSNYPVSSTARYLGVRDKYVSLPIEEDFGYATESYTGGISHEPTYFTREYLLESPVTRSYDDAYQYLSSTTQEPKTTTRDVPKKYATRKPARVTQRFSTTTRPRTPKPYEKINVPTEKKVYKPIENYDYYDDSHEKLAGKYSEDTKVVLHDRGVIQCLDIGNFPHPVSCKKFIQCARMESGQLRGWEYVCPKGLSYDPVGGICNWSAGLGCNE